METFLDSPILQALAAAWLATGLVKGLIVAQQFPAIMAWWVFYRTNDTDKAAEWYKDKILVFCMILTVIVSTILFTIVSPIMILGRREWGLKYFRPYGDPYLADMVATHLKMPTGVSPTEFETWDQYQTRIGHDPKEVADAIILVQPRVPQEISKMLEEAKETAGRLQELQNRKDIKVDEDEEFRDK